jgi:hypothetical protein
MDLRRNIHRIARNAVAAFTMSAVALVSIAQRPKVLAPHDPVPPRMDKDKQPPLPPAKAGSVVGGPWMIGADLKSTIYIKNLSVNSDSLSPADHGAGK